MRGGGIIVLGVTSQLPLRFVPTGNFGGADVWTRTINVDREGNRSRVLILEHDVTLRKDLCDRSTVRIGSPFSELPLVTGCLWPGP